MANRNPMMNQQPMMANLNSPVSMGAMMNNMTMGGRPPMGQPPNRSMPGWPGGEPGWGGPYGGISHAVEKGKRQAGYYDTELGPILAEFARQEEAEENVNDAIDDMKWHYQWGTWGGRRPMDDLFGKETTPPHDPDSLYLPWFAPGSGFKRMPTQRNPLAK